MSRRPLSLIMSWFFWALGATPKSQIEPGHFSRTHPKSPLPRDEKGSKVRLERHHAVYARDAWSSALWRLTSSQSRRGDAPYVRICGGSGEQSLVPTATGRFEARGTGGIRWEAVARGD